MRLYHGSPKLLESLRPQKAKGRNDYENLEAIFLTTEFTKAALYAIGKNLKGITGFSVKRGKLTIMGNHRLGDGYVYEFDIEEEKLMKSAYTDEYASKEEIKPIKVHETHSKDYEKYVVRVNTKEELFSHAEEHP